MNLKHLSLIFLIFCIFLVSISVISANEHVNETLTESDTMDLKDNSVEEVLQANESSTDNPTTVNSNDSQTSQTKTAIKTKVSAPTAIKTYKKKGTFKITVKDISKKPIKKLKLNVKVYTGKKSKIYKIKTNTKGIATLNTKNFKIGNHKVIISSANKDYNVSKKSKIIIGKKKTATLKFDKIKKFKNGDYFRFFKQSKDGQYEKGIYTENLRVHKNNQYDVKSHFIVKVKYTFKNIKGITITKVSTSKDMFKTKLIIGYEPVSAKITYIES